jgi:DNA-directed RNA polymerase subunit RPC12/RpoP
MSYNREILVSVRILCFKCTKVLTISRDPVILGGRLFECKACDYKVVVKDGDIR